MTYTQIHAWLVLAAASSFATEGLKRGTICWTFSVAQPIFSNSLSSDYLENKVAHIYNPSTGKAEAGGSVQGQPELCSEVLYLKTEQTNKNDLGGVSVV